MIENKTKRRPTTSGKPPFGANRAFQKKKVCRFCSDKKMKPDYKDIRTTKPFVSERGKITPARITGNCAKHQRAVTTAIKQARIIAILPFSTTVG